MLQEQMDSMASMNRASEEAANQRAIDQRGFQYDMLVYQAAVKERYCRQKTQAAHNAEISKSNDQALKYAELTNTLPPPMRQAGCSLRVIHVALYWLCAVGARWMREHSVSTFHKKLTSRRDAALRL
ncbi:TPA: hypothetical protein ACH3X3_004917 [Trebouxia sp. C0006]